LELTFKIAYTVFICILIPVYWKKYGPANFLWFSDIALFGIGIAMWIESSLIASMMALAVLIPETFWNIGYFGRLITGKRMFGLSEYMFDESKSLFLRGLSLFHVIIPFALIWLLINLGYNDEAIFWQTGLASIVIPITYFFTDPEENINWVFGPGEKPQKRIPPPLYLLAVMLFFPVFIYLPTHFLLIWLFE
jgi:hypothetical protein